MKRVHDGYTFLVVILIFQSVSRPILHWTAVRSIGHRKIISNISARGHCGLNVFADSERLGMISCLSYIISKWPSCTVWKLLITEVLAVTSLLGRKKRRFWGSKTPLKVFFHPSHTQKALPCVKTRRLSHQPSISVQAFDLCTCARKKRDGNMDKT